MVYQKLSKKNPINTLALIRTGTCIFGPFRFESSVWVKCSDLFICSSGVFTLSTRKPGFKSTFHLIFTSFNLDLNAYLILHRSSIALGPSLITVCQKLTKFKENDLVKARVTKTIYKIG